MALLRQCLLELRAAQELALSRQMRPALRMPALERDPWPLDMASANLPKHAQLSGQSKGSLTAPVSCEHLIRRRK